MQALKQAASNRPADYLEDVFAHAETIAPHYVELSVKNYDKLCQKYRADHVSIYDRIQQTMRLQEAEQTTQDKNAPGEVFLRFLRQFGFNISPDCPCRKKIAIINARGVDWALENREQIAAWFIDEADKWGKTVSQEFAADLIARAFAFSRRHEKLQTQFTVDTENG